MVVAVHNPVQALAEIVAKLHDDDGYIRFHISMMM